MITRHQCLPQESFSNDFVFFVYPRGKIRAQCRQLSRVIYTQIKRVCEFDNEKLCFRRHTPVQSCRFSYVKHFCQPFFYLGKFSANKGKSPNFNFL